MVLILLLWQAQRERANILTNQTVAWAAATKALEKTEGMKARIEQLEREIAQLEAQDREHAAYWETLSREVDDLKRRTDAEDD